MVKKKCDIIIVQIIRNGKCEMQFKGGNFERKIRKALRQAERKYEK